MEANLALIESGKGSEKDIVRVAYCWAGTGTLKTQKNAAFIRSFDFDSLGPPDFYLWWSVSVTLTVPPSLTSIPCLAVS
jgi:hypothetical protein